VSLLVEVAFKGNRKEFFVWESDESPPRATPVIVDADRGEDLGRVHSVGPEAEHRSAKVPHGLLGAPATRVVKRLATAEELRRHEELRAGDDEARRKAMERVKANALVMKMTDAEWQWDRKKLTFYFTAEKRVDFRTLVRELASMFRTRIELKQIGVRDEAKRLDGIGRCGRQYCSASWLPELRPVNLGVAKDQRLSLNPSQISGACGRLMCCLRYEHEFYVQSRRKYPKEGKVVRTSLGEEKVVANDIFRERVTLRGVEGEMRTIPLTELRDEMTASGDALAAALEAAAH
jgi:cell fate regulator YaaT (PSP1 superfamily)